MNTWQQALRRWAPGVQRTWRPLMRGFRASAQRLGLPGRVGLCLCALGLILWAGILPAQRGQIDELAAHNDWLQQRLSGMSMQQPATTAPDGAAGADVPMTPQARWARVWRALPTSSQAGPQQATLLRDAPGLSADPVSFSHERVGALPGLRRWRLMVSTTAPWGLQLQWLRRVQSEPAFSIDAIALQREQPQDAVWQMRLSVSLWTRDPEVSRPLTDKDLPQPSLTVARTEGP